MSAPVVPFSGRTSLVALDDDPFRGQTLRQLESVQQAVEARVAGIGGGGLWMSLRDNLQDLKLKLRDPSGSHVVQLYKLQMLNDAVLPYIKDKMLSNMRLSLEKVRFIQIQQLLLHLSPSSSSFSCAHEHPALVLTAVDRLVEEIKRERSLWPSELATSLDSAAQKQWIPILHDHRVLLHNIGGKAVLFGIVEIIGRPVIMLYPVYLLSVEITRLAGKLGVTQSLLEQGAAGARHIDWRRLSVSDGLQIAKLVAMCWAVFQVLTVLSAYTGLGYSCLGVGFAALTLASNDALLKQYTPALAPHIASVGRLMDQACALEQSVLLALSQQQHQHHQQQQPVFVSSVRVEELSPSSPSSPSSSLSSSGRDPVATAIPSGGDDGSVLAFAETAGSGLRRRQ